jgi:Tol biopolymer transport system component
MFNLTNSSSDIYTPRTSPDGSNIAYRIYHNGLYLVSSDGSENTKIVTTPDHCESPSWSADGTSLAFHAFNDVVGSDIYTVQSDGTGLIRLTDNDYYDENPSWSPEGDKIVFSSTRDGSREIYVMNSDGSNVRRLTYNSDDDLYPRWKP